MKRNKFSVARKSIWFLLRIVLVSVAIVVLCIAALFEGMHISNLYIIVTEGLTRRAECVLQDGASEELYEYFTGDFVAADERLNGGAYDNFTVTAFDYRFEFKGLSVLPWGGTATVTGIERMAGMNGSIKEDAPEDAQYPLPEWGTALVRLHFVQRDSRWYISEIEVLETDPEEEPRPTPDMSLLDDAQ